MSASEQLSDDTIESALESANAASAKVETVLTLLGIVDGYDGLDLVALVDGVESVAREVETSIHSCVDCLTQARGNGEYIHLEKASDVAE